MRKSVKLYSVYFNLFVYNIKNIQRNYVVFIIMFIELGFKLCFTLPQFSQSYFLPAEVSIGQILHFSVHSYTLHYKARFFFSSNEGSYSPKQSFIVKVWSFTKNKLRHNLQVKTDSVIDFITDISSKSLKNLLKKDQVTFRISNQTSSRDLKLYQKLTPAQTPSLPFLVKLSHL